MTATLEIIDQLASRQWSLVSRQQLVEAGISRPRIASLLHSGTLRRTGYRVYSTFGAPESWEREALTAVLARGSGAEIRRQAGVPDLEGAFLQLGSEDPPA